MSKRSQISLVLRYIYNNSVRVDIVMFTDAFDEVLALLEISQNNEETEKNGEEKKKFLITEEVLVVNSINLDLKKYVGVRNNVCSVMVSKICEIIKVALNVHRCPCYNDLLNNSKSQSSRVKSIRNLSGVIIM